MLCLPRGSPRVSNDRLKLEQTFESRQDGSVEKPKLLQEILHARHVKSGTPAFGAPWPSGEYTTRSPAADDKGIASTHRRAWTAVLTFSAARGRQSLRRLLGRLAIAALLVAHESPRRGHRRAHYVSC